MINWKERYTELKLGDRVKVIKINPYCHVSSNEDRPGCCGKYLNHIGILKDINEHRITDKEKKYRVTINNSSFTGSCMFHKECLQKV